MVEDLLERLVKSDRYTIDRHIQMLDGYNMQMGTSVGTMIATSGLQKLGFFGITPIVQPTGVAVTAGGIHAALVSLGLITA